MPGAFEASPELDHDALATAEEIGHRGQDVLRWLAGLAESESPRAVDIHLIFEIHRRWFDSTFPVDAGHPRTSMVLNRKGTAVEVPSIVPALVNACDTGRIVASTADPPPTRCSSQVWSPKRTR